MTERFYTDQLNGALKDPRKTVDQKLNAIISSNASSEDRIQALQTVRGSSTMRPGIPNNEVVMVCTVIVNREMKK